MSEVITNATTQTSAAPTNEAKKEEENKFHFKNGNPIRFQESLKISHLRTDELTTIINDIFRERFPDYWGCSLTNDLVNFVPQLTLAFRHRDNVSADTVQATINLTDAPKKGDNKIIAGVNFLNNTQFNQRIYDLSVAGKDILESFMIEEAKNNFTIAPNGTSLIANTTKLNTNSKSKINWDNHVCQVDDPTAGKLLTVKHLSLDKIAGFAFGEVVDGEPIQYHVSLERNIGGYAASFGFASSSLYSIAAANASEISRLLNKVNTTPMNINTPASAFIRA